MSTYQSSTICREVNELKNRSFTGFSRLSIELLIIVLLVGCGGGPSTDSDGEPRSVTFAKSFGGPWEDSASKLTVDAEGRLVVAVKYRADAVGGTEELPWLIALDPVGEPHWQITPTIPLGTGGGTSVGSLWRESTASGGRIRIGKVWNTETGWDVFMQRADGGQNMLWTVELDSGGIIGGYNGICSNRGLSGNWCIGVCVIRIFVFFTSNW